MGDGRKFCSALFTLDVGAILRDKIGVESHRIPKDPGEQLSMLKENGHSITDFTDSDDVKSEIQLLVNELNRSILQSRTIKEIFDPATRFYHR